MENFRDKFPFTGPVEKAKSFHTPLWTKFAAASKGFPGFPHKIPLLRLLLPNIL